MFLHLLQVNHTTILLQTDCFVTTAASIADWTIHGKVKPKTYIRKEEAILDHHLNSRNFTT